jgi:hypothetical protein
VYGALLAAPFPGRGDEGAASGAPYSRMVGQYNNPMQVIWHALSLFLIDIQGGSDYMY